MLTIENIPFDSLCDNIIQNVYIYIYIHDVIHLSFYNKCEQIMSALLLSYIIV